MPSEFPSPPPGTETFDVRPLLARGEEPFDAIQERWGGLAQGGYLAIRAPFFPGPLVAHFSMQGISARPFNPKPEDFWLLLGPKP